MQLTIEIDRQQQLPIYLQICERFKTAIAAGHLRPGDRVPALRGLATQLNTARGTVELAYTILVDEGYLQMRGAAGTFVSSSLPASVYAVARRRARAASARMRRAREARRARRAIHRQRAKPLQPGLPALDAFPRKVWNRLVAYRARSGELAMLTYPDPAGYRPLREHIATYLGLSRGVDLRAGTGVRDRRLSCDARTRAAQSRAARTIACGSRIPAICSRAVFWPRPACSSCRCRWISEGIDVERGITLDAEARFALVTPSHQSPLGHTLSLARRMALLDWARARGQLDHRGRLRQRVPLSGPSIAGVEEPRPRDRVIYCGTFSKVMFPGLRLAYAVVPERAVERVGRVTHSMNAGSPTLLQAAVADFIAQGHFARHLKRMRALYGERRMLIVHALEQAFGERLIVDLPPGGMQFAVQFARAPLAPSTTSPSPHARARRGSRCCRFRSGTRMARTSARCAAS